MRLTDFTEQVPQTVYGEGSVSFIFLSNPFYTDTFIKYKIVLMDIMTKKIVTTACQCLCSVLYFLTVNE